MPPSGKAHALHIEIWSDVVCPWCYIGKRRLEHALELFEYADDVNVEWRSFELAPDALPSSHASIEEMLAGKYGVTRDQAAQMNEHVTRIAADEGLAFRLDLARPAGSFDAHRLLHMAAARGLQHAAKERLLAAYFSEGHAIGDHDTLAALGGDIGLEVTAVRDVLATDAFADAVRADEQFAARLGITAVPFFVIDRRFGISGAQPAEQMLEALRTAHAEPARAPR